MLMMILQFIIFSVFIQAVVVSIWLLPKQPLPPREKDKTQLNPAYIRWHREVYLREKRQTPPGIDPYFNDPYF